MGRKNPSDRYIVFHSALGEVPFQTLREARKFRRHFEQASWNTGYAATIYDTVLKRVVYW